MKVGSGIGLILGRGRDLYRIWAKLEAGREICLELAKEPTFRDLDVFSPVSEALAHAEFDKALRISSRHPSLRDWLFARLETNNLV